MQYFDKNGKEIKAGMKILMEDGSIELVHETVDAYGEKVSKEDYEKYEAAIARRTTLTSMLGEDSPAPEITMQ